MDMLWVLWLFLWGEHLNIETFTLQPDFDVKTRFLLTNTMLFPYKNTIPNYVNERLTYKKHLQCSVLTERVTTTILITVQTNITILL